MTINWDAVATQAMNAASTSFGPKWQSRLQKPLTTCVERLINTAQLASRISDKNLRKLHVEPFRYEITEELQKNGASHGDAVKAADAATDLVQNIL